MMKQKRIAVLLLTAFLTVIGFSACRNSSTDTARIDANFSIGAKTDTAYSNRFFEIAFTLPDENWRFLTDEEIATSVNAIQRELQDVDAVKTALEGNDTYFDVIALNTVDNSQINITLGRVPELSDEITTEAILDQTLTELGSALEGMGATNVNGARSTATFQGGTVPITDITFNLAGYAVYEKQVILMKGSYIATITVSSYGEDLTQQYLDQFTKP